MSVTPSSPYLSSSSSVETTLSSSSLSGSQSVSSSLDHARKESWEEADGTTLVRSPVRTLDDADAWKGGVSLRKGWEFMDNSKALAPQSNASNADGQPQRAGQGRPGSSLGGGRREDDPNRVSVASTVKLPTDSPARAAPADQPPSPSSWMRSSRPSSVAGKAALADEGSTSSDAGELAPSASSASTSSTSLANDKHGHDGIRPLPTPQPSMTQLKGIRPLPTPPAMSEPAASTTFFPTPPGSTLAPATRKRSITHTPSTSSISHTSTPSGTPASSRSQTPPPSSAGGGPSHQRSFSAQPQQDLLRPGRLATDPSSSAPSLPIKPTWLQSRSLSTGPGSPTVSQEPSPTAEGSTPSPSAGSTSTATASPALQAPLRRTNSPPSPLPLSPAPLLPPRPTPQVQKHVAQAEFAPSAPPHAAVRAGAGVRTHGASASLSARPPPPPGGGIKNRLAAFAGAVYHESNAYFAQNEASSSAAPSTSATTKSPKALHQVLFSAPGSAVRSLNSSWRGTKVASSSSQPALSSSGGTRKPVAYDPSGPAGSLGPGEGKLFGREIDGQGTQWPMTVKAKAPSGGKKRMSVGGVGVLVSGKGREILPALVVRCVDYLEIWGPREEGIFRLSGRATHVQKLRNQFDTGADIDLSLTDASELDPNAVASVFKAYLRELPSPILTSTLTPAFDVVLRKYTGSPARDNGFGTSSVARPEGSLKNADEKAALLKEVKELLVQLPEVHWWLIKAVTSLLDHTAKFSHENKMTLSNLLLVFCPSLCLSPPFLRLLVENHTTLLDDSTRPETTDGAFVPFPTKAPALPARPVAKVAAPAPQSHQGHTRTISSVSVDPPKLDPPNLETSPLPTFSALAPSTSNTSAASGRRSQDSHGSSASTSSPAKKGGLFSRSGVAAAEGTSPSSWTGSVGKRRNMSTPPSPRQGSNTEGGLLLDIAGGKKNASSVDLPLGAPTSSNPSGQADVPVSRRASEDSQPLRSPATEEPPADVLPPTGVVAARRHIFGTPISDRFKSTSTPTFHSFRRNSPKASPDALPPAPLAESTSSSSASSLSAVKLRGGRHGGGGLFGAKVTPMPKDLTSSSSGKKGMWKRGSAMVGLGGHGSAAGVEEGLGRTVFDAVRALEGGASGRPN